MENINCFMEISSGSIPYKIERNEKTWAAKRIATIF